jgi:predicted RNA-binding Zn-ribbon protein involved in translation (DUF1610 family)
MPDTNKMLCPDCGVEMNQHATKIDYASALDDASEIDEDLGGVLEDVHTCPACGQTHMQKAATNAKSL